MLFILFLLIILFIGESYGIKQKPFDSQEIRQRRNDPNIKTISDQFLIFFDEICLAQKQENQQDVIQEFLNEFKCYSQNEQLVDEYRGISNHWIVVNRLLNCYNDDEKIIKFDNYCIIDVCEDEENEVQQYQYQCLSRNVQDALWNLNYLNPSIIDGFEFIKYDPSFISSIDIIVMDSGIDATHSEFDGIIISRIYDAFPDEPNDIRGHGTHVTGTFVGYNYGVFRAANTQFNVYDVRVFPTSGSTSSANILNGYQAIISYLQGSGKKAIINMSFGGGGILPEKNLLLQEITDNGGIIIAAAGNDNTRAEEKSPASSYNTIAVGALNENNKKAEFSNYGHFVDIWAPGVNIKSAFPNERAALWSGTSMASPLVAGVAANLLAIHSNFQLDDIKAALLNAAIYDVNDEHGLINEPRVQASCLLYTQPNTTIPSIMLREKLSCHKNCSICGSRIGCENSALGCIQINDDCQALEQHLVDPIVGEAICNGPTLTGSTIETPYGAAFYTFKISNAGSGTTVKLLLCGFDVFVFLYDEDLNLIQSQDIYICDNMTVSNVQNGNYIIRVDGYIEDVGTYSLDVKCDISVIPNCFDQSRCLRSEITRLHHCTECLFKICIIYDPNKEECIKNGIEPIDHICTRSGGPTKICHGNQDNQEFCCKDCVENPFAPSYLCRDTGLGNIDTCGGIINCRILRANQDFIFAIKDGNGGCIDFVENPLGNTLNIDWICQRPANDGNICAGGNNQECQWSIKIPESYCT